MLIKGKSLRELFSFALKQTHFFGAKLELE